MEELLKKHGLPLRTGYSAQELAEVALSDKKRAGGSINLAIPCSLGESRLLKISVDELIDWAQAGLKA